MYALYMHYVRMHGHNALNARAGLSPTTVSTVLYSDQKSGGVGGARVNVFGVWVWASDLEDPDL